MRPEAQAALIGGVCGSFAGSVVAVAGQYLLVSRTERRERRAASRLVESEMVGLYGAVRTGLETEEWALFGSLREPVEWPKYRELLARHRRTAWARCSTAFASYEILIQLGATLQEHHDGLAHPERMNQDGRLAAVATGTLAALRSGHRAIAPWYVHLALRRLHPMATTSARGPTSSDRREDA
jgi:hypothetical protein